MPDIQTADGRYVLAVQGDGNAVVYDTSRGHPWTPVWDRWGWEATHGAPPKLPVPIPSQPSPLPPTAPRVIRVTDERDGDLVPRMYSYWPTAWVNTALNSAFVFVGQEDSLPRFFKVDLADGSVTRLGPLIGGAYRGTSEGLYWDRDGWIYICDGPRLRRVNPFTGEDRTVFSIEERQPGCDLWQAHSSDDGQTHSATVRRVVPDGAYPKIGTVVAQPGRQSFYGAAGVLDESQITPDGGFLVIKEDDDNRIVDLVVGTARLLRDEHGAVGHSDCGPSYIVGEVDMPGPGVCAYVDLRKPLGLQYRRVLFNTDNMGYVSVRGGRCLHSDATHLNLVALDGSGITPLVAHGNVGSDYDDRVKANLDPTGRVACYMSNQFGRRDVFLLVL